MLVDVRFKWKLIGGDAFEMSFNGFTSVESAQDAFDDFWCVKAADCDYFERDVTATHEVPAGEEDDS
jgi:hypothetical protein